MRFRSLSDRRREPVVVRLITTTVYCDAVHNIYFELTEAFNAHGPTVALASGQAVVFYRIAIMSKDGDWVIRETPQACERVLAELERRSAYYRPGAPLDVRWLAGGWSSCAWCTSRSATWRNDCCRWIRREVQAMRMLSEDDVSIRGLGPEELDAAWDWLARRA